MVAFIAIASKEFFQWDEHPQIQIEAETRQEIVTIAYVFSALNKNSTVRLSDSKGYNNQGSYINNNEKIKILYP